MLSGCQAVLIYKAIHCFVYCGNSNIVSNNSSLLSDSVILHAALHLGIMCSHCIILKLLNQNRRPLAIIIILLRALCAFANVHAHTMAILRQLGCE